MMVIMMEINMFQRYRETNRQTNREEGEKLQADR